MKNDAVIRKLLNAGIRGLSLTSKLILTLYMGRYLGLADLGIYGLVFAAVTISTAILGVRLDYVVARELVGASRLETTRKIRDQIAFYGINYSLYALVALCAYFAKAASAEILSAIFIISIFGNFSGAMATNLVALGSPLFSNFLFFVRSGLWSLIIVGLGLFLPSYRNVETILLFWAMGEVLSVIVNAWAWRRLPWGEASLVPIDWAKIFSAMRTCLPTWLGTIGAIFALSVDRFVVSHFLDIEKVGIITFYGSFSTALLSLVQSGFFAFSYPRMISHFRERNYFSFVAEIKKTGKEAALFVVLAGIGLGFIIPWMGPLLNKPELMEESATLWLMIFAIWLRTNADTFYYALYAMEKDKPLWLGSLLFLVPSVGCNLLFVPYLGLEGTGYSAIVACLFLLLWRVWHFKRHFGK